MIYEPLFELEKNGINIKYHTNQGEYTPAHWHGAIELMYILNGVGTILIEGKEYKMIAGEFIVVDSNQIHEARCSQGFHDDSDSFFKKCDDSDRTKSGKV